MNIWWCEQAWLDGAPVASVRVVVDGGVIADVQPAVVAESGDERIAGLVLPGLANAHSHAFHRALRGRTHSGRGTFWTWREQMYAVAGRLDPDSYLALARAAYAEMALAGVTCVGEFHYLHHGPAGRPYDDPNAMAAALVQAAADAGVRLTLLDACYLAGGLTGDGHRPLDNVQVRFSDGDADAWAARLRALPESPGVRVGAAVHSVRAVPAQQLDTVRAAAGGRPLHLHLSEQPAENQACLAFYRRTPAALLADHGLLGSRTTAVHATHLDDEDLSLLGRSRTTVCACPTTEADLADGIGPFARLRDAGSPVCVGSDQHVAIDLIAEARLVEWYERLATGRRGTFTAPELVSAATEAGQAALGWPDAGRIVTGCRADLVALDLASVRTAGMDPGQAVLVASATDVRTVVVDGTVVVRDGQHVLGDVGGLLRAAIEPLWEDA